MCAKRFEISIKGSSILIGRFVSVHTKPEEFENAALCDMLRDKLLRH